LTIYTYISEQDHRCRHIFCKKKTLKTRFLTAYWRWRVWLGCDALLSSLDMGRTVKWYCPCPLQTRNFNLGTHGMCPLTTFICITTQPDCLLPPILPEHFISCTIKNYFTKHAFVFYSCNIGESWHCFFFPGRLLIVLDADCEISGWGWGIGLFLGVLSTGAGLCLFMKDGPAWVFTCLLTMGFGKERHVSFPVSLFIFSWTSTPHILCKRVAYKKWRKKTIMFFR